MHDDPTTPPGSRTESHSTGATPAESVPRRKRRPSVDLHDMAFSLGMTADGAMADAARVKAQAVAFKDSVVADATRHLQAVRAAMPASKAAAMLALNNTELQFLVRAPWLLGLFVPPPSWPPETLTVKAPRVIATVMATCVLTAMAVGGLVALLLVFVWTGAILLPLVLVLAPLLATAYAAVWAYYRRRPHLPAPPVIVTSLAATREAEKKARTEMAAAEKLLCETRWDWEKGA